MCTIDEGLSEQRLQSIKGRCLKEQYGFQGKGTLARKERRVNSFFCLARASLLGSVSFTALLWIRHCCPLNFTSSTTQWSLQHRTCFVMRLVEGEQLKTLQQRGTLQCTLQQRRQRPVDEKCSEEKTVKITAKGRRRQFPEWNITASCLLCMNFHDITITIIFWRVVIFFAGLWGTDEKGIEGLFS